MRRFEPEDLERWSGGRWVGDGPRMPVTGFCYDTRKLERGDLFVAIKTAARDGHAFLEEARSKGASGALVGAFQESSELPQLLVEDTLKGFRSIANGYRNSWDAEVIAVTGSCGKTTVKDLLLHLLGGFPAAQGTSGNLNNLIGVPATLLAVDTEGLSCVVVEAGISEPGEMVELARTIDPDRVVYTAIGPAHLELLGDEETVASEKGALGSQSRARQAYLGETCEAYRDLLFPENRTRVAPERPESPARWSYSTSREGMTSVIKLQGPEKVERYRVEGVGKAIASNASLAIAVARDLGVPESVVAERLAAWKPVGMRGEWRTLGKLNVYLDCYNANPLSMRESLETFKTVSKDERPRLYAIGCMEELGSRSAKLHEELGESLALRPQDRLYVVGDAAKHVLEGMKKADNRIENAKAVSGVEALSSILNGFEGDLFLKGSRRYRLETILDFVSAESPRKEGVAC